MCQEIFIYPRVDNTPYQDFKPSVSHIMVHCFYCTSYIALSPSAMLLVKQLL